MKRVPPSVRLKEEVEDLLRGSEAPSSETPVVGFVRQLAQYILQVSIEAEATAFLGRGHYRRGDPGGVAYQYPHLAGNRLRRHRRVHVWELRPATFCGRVRNGVRGKKMQGDSLSQRE